MKAFSVDTNVNVERLTEDLEKLSKESNKDRKENDMTKELSIENIKKEIIDKLLNDLDILNHFKEYAGEAYNIPISKFLNQFIFDCDAVNVGCDYISVEVAEHEISRPLNSNYKKYIVSIKMGLKKEYDICKMASTVSDIVNSVAPLSA